MDIIALVTIDEKEYTKHDYSVTMLQRYIEKEREHGKGQETKEQILVITTYNEILAETYPKIIRDELMKTEITPLEQTGEEATDIDKSIIKITKNCHIVLMEHNKWIENQLDALNHFELLQDYLQKVERLNYTKVFIDCPASVSYFTLNAITLSTQILTYMIYEDYSRKLFQHLKKIIESYVEERDHLLIIQSIDEIAKLSLSVFRDDFGTTEYLLLDKGKPHSFQLNNFRLLELALNTIK